jgi:hypothetical protein
VIFSKKPRTYQTYTKTNPVTDQVYAGRTSGTGTPRENISRRERAGHKWTKKGYGPADLDETSSNYDAIRGREQMLKDYYHRIGKGAPQDEPISPRKKHLRQHYLNEALREFGPL